MASGAGFGRVFEGNPIQNAPETGPGSHIYTPEALLTNLEYLKAVWLEIFVPVFVGFSAEIDPRDTTKSPGPGPHINFHGKSAPQTNSKSKW